MLHRTTLETPLGELLLVASPTGLRAVLWPGEGTERVHLGDGRTRGAPLDELPEADLTTHPILSAAVEQLREWFAGRRDSFDVPLEPQGTEFQQEVWAVLRAIPYGEVITYGEQARRVGRPSAFRAVGAANGKNPLSIVVPCHRVVGAKGALTGFAAGTDVKAWLLDHERAVRAGVAG